MAWVLTASAVAATADVVFPDGTPQIGDTVVLEVSVTADGALLAGAEPTLRAETGLVRAARGEAAPGRWVFLYQALNEHDTLTVQIGADTVRRWEVHPKPAAPPALALAGDTLGSATRRRPYTFSVTGPALLDPDELRVTVPEGTAEVVADGGSVAVQWKAGGLSYPRAVPIAVRSLDLPGPPAWHVLSLQAGLTLPIETSPSSEVTVTVGRRRYGPFYADDEGYTVPALDVRPGETSAEVLVVDPLGNHQRSTVALGGSILPILAAEVEGTLHPDLPPPVVHLLGLQPSGRPWRRGADLSCTDSRGNTLEATFDGGGRWRVPVPLPVAPIAPERVDCVLAGQASAAATVPLGELPPTSLMLRVDPPVLNADSPEATIRAYVEDLRGQRGSIEQLSVSAAHGALQIAPAGSYISGLYNGREAIPYQEAVLTATWSRPTSTRTPWQLVLSATAGTDAVVLSGRVLDRNGDAVEGQEVSFRVQDVERSAESDARGWATVTFPALAGAAARVVVTSASLERQALLLPGQSLGGSPALPDLQVIKRVPVRAGNVRGIFVTTEPRIIAANSGVARVEVRPVDRDNNPVLDEEIILRASQGQLSMIEPEPDGSYFATYTPPAGIDQATVEITATTADGGYAATTDLTILPRVFEQMLSISGGTLWNSRAAALGGWISARYSRQLPQTFSSGEAVFSTWWHIDLGGYQVHIEEDIPSLGSSLDLRVLINTGGLGGSIRRQQRRRSAWAGATLSPSVFWQQARLDGIEVSRGWGASTSPIGGLQLFAGAGWQLGGGEWQLQLRAFTKAHATSTVGWEGQVGGVALTAGYNFLF